MMSEIELAGLAPGFTSALFDHRRACPAVLDAMARPGTVHPLPVMPRPPAPLSPAAAAVCLTLIDRDAPLWLDRAEWGEAVTYLRAGRGCAVVERPESAVFGLIAPNGSIPPLDRFAQGEPDYPDRSATLIIQVSALTSGSGRRLVGPGVARGARLSIVGLTESFWHAWAVNHARLPLGVDVIFAAGNVIAALPRMIREG